jgi:hypothetical protein
MTAQILLRIDLTEIAALEITCSECGAMFTLPLLIKDTVSQPWNCVCNTRLWDGDQDQAYVRLLGLVRSLSNWKRLPEPKKFSIGFSLTQPTKTLPALVS